MEGGALYAISYPTPALVYVSPYPIRLRKLSRFYRSLHDEWSPNIVQTSLPDTMSRRACQSCCRYSTLMYGTSTKPFGHLTPIAVSLGCSQGFHSVVRMNGISLVPNMRPREFKRTAKTKTRVDQHTRRSPANVPAIMCCFF